MSTSPYVIDHAETFRLAPPPEDVWSALEQTDQFTAWWPWLSEFVIEGRGLEAGSVLRGVVAPPLPYRMQVRVLLEECDRPHHIAASVHGDLVGQATLHLEPDGGGTLASSTWAVEMMQLSMRVAARLAHPVLRWGHDRVVDATVDGFRRRLLDPPRR